MKVCVLVMSLLPVAAMAQVQILLYNGTSDVPVPTTLGTFAAGSTYDILFDACNSTPAWTLTSLGASGADLTLVHAPVLPFVVPATCQRLDVQFSPPSPGLFSATLAANGVTVILFATATASPNVAVTSCQDPNSSSTVNFGRVTRGQTKTCSVSLTNNYSASLTVQSIAASPSAFTVAGATAPLMLAPGQTASLQISFTPAVDGVTSGALKVDSQIITLTGQGTDPPLPQPTFQLDSAGGALASAQQRTLSILIPGGSPVTVSGTITLTFQPASPVVPDDPTILFLSTNSRNLSFTVKQGDSQLTLNGQPSAVFQTGTTAGTVTFTVNAGIIGVSGSAVSSMAIPPETIQVDTFTAESESGSLLINAIGYDNTYTAGALSFTFYDLNGKIINPGTINADFTKQFATYFESSYTAVGSAFNLLVTFPVTGADTSQVGSVQVSLTNSAGTVQTQQITFN